jgi:endoglucanase
MRRRHAMTAGASLGLLPWSLPIGAATSVKPLKALVADDFRLARQRGVGFGLLQGGERSSADQDAVVELGANHVRLWVDPVRDDAGQSYRIPPKQLAVLANMLDSLEQRGIYTVLAANWGPDARDGLWRSAALQNSVVQVWQQLALHLRGRAAIAGLDIVNEPVPPGVTFAVRQDRWLDLAVQIVKGVRAVDPSRVLMVQSAPDATPASFENMRPLPFDGLVYSVHSYFPMEFTHQGVMSEFAKARAYPEPMSNGRTSVQRLADELAPVQRFAQRHDVPIWVGEFSAPRWAPDGSAARYLADSIALFNQYGWSWAYHEFRTWHGWDPEMSAVKAEDQQRSRTAPVVQVLRAGMRAGVTAGARTSRG